MLQLTRGDKSVLLQVVEEGSNSTEVPADEAEAEVAASSPAMILYTSGTTGPPKERPLSTRLQ